jgi:hypothetical protein
MTTLTIEMPDEVRAVIDEARGEQDVASFLLTVGERAARRRVARRAAPDELTPADHIRMAAEAEATASPITEVMQRLNAYMDAAMAEDAAAQ